MSTRQVRLSEAAAATSGGAAGGQRSGESVDVHQARKSFGAKVALDGVGLTVPAGAFCVLLGPSGSGKTTLLRCVAGIERLSAGQISIGNNVVADGSAHRPPDKRNLSMVFQDYALWPHLTAARNVEFALRRRHLPKPDRAARAAKMLERVGLGHLSHRYPNELSGGEQQRVALARALVADTGVLLFDEPLSNLDADLRERMRLEIATLTRASGTTSLYITHDQSEAFALADIIGVLQDGRLVQLGSPEEVYHRPATPFVARFTGLAGELPVIVTGGETASNGAGSAGSDRRVMVRLAGPDTGGGDIEATVAAGGLPGAAATMLIRDTGVHLLPAGDPEGHLAAIVVDSAYRGRGYDHALLVGDSAQLVGVHDQRRWVRGDRVAVRLLARGCLVFPATAGSTAG